MDNNKEEIKTKERKLPGLRGAGLTSLAALLGVLIAGGIIYLSNSFSVNLNSGVSNSADAPFNYLVSGKQAAAVLKASLLRKLV